MAQDSSKADFWDVRYQGNVTPWDSAGLPEGFVSHAQSILAAAANKTVLIPGCGTAYELAWLRQQGGDALAFDFSTQAVARARQAFPALAAHIIEADFFGPAISGQWDWVYERAFLCALPPSLAKDYARRMAELVVPGGRLAGYFFLRPQPKGPPFGMVLADLEQILSPYFMLQKQVPVAESLPVFSPDECWLEWHRVVE